MLRRLRQDERIRELVREVRVSHRQMIQPYFVVDGIDARQEIAGMSGVYRETPESVIRQIESDLEKGVHKALFFFVPSQKSERLFQFDFASQQIRRLKERFKSDLWIATDVCLCSSTTHGQCGVVNSMGTQVENGPTVEILAKAALQYAQAGADCVAPSDMMDGRVRAIRETLAAAGLDQTILMSYAAKFDSRYYGPFRNAADSAPKGNVLLKNRATYQIDPARPSDAFACAERDAAEGADLLMVKPALPYLDVLATLTAAIRKPWAVYEVSGEYAAIETLGTAGLMDAPAAHCENWTAMIRAGAQIIITYGARHAREYLGRVGA